MVKNKMLKILGGVIVACLLFTGSIFGTYKIVQAKNFNDLVNSANQKLNTGNYDEAISLYNKALQIKNDNDVKQNINMAQNYKKYQDVYNEGLQLITEKKYSDAIQKLGAINQMAGQLYVNAQSKIEECKKNIISEDINATNTAISNKDYDSANKYVEDILKIDANNGDAKQLQTTITQTQQKDKEEAEQKITVEQGKMEHKNIVQTATNKNSKRIKQIDKMLEVIEDRLQLSMNQGGQPRMILKLQQETLLKEKEELLKSQ